MSECITCFLSKDSLCSKRRAGNGGRCEPLDTTAEKAGGRGNRSLLAEAVGDELVGHVLGALQPEDEFEEFECL